MKFRTLVGGIGTLLALAGCGSGIGGAGSAPAAAEGQSALATAADGTPTFAGARGSYTITKSGGTFTVTSNTDAGDTTTVTEAQSLRFADMTVNLVVGDKARMLGSADLKMLIELYVAFFNRVPDADGLAYWIDQFKAGRSIAQIADGFYGAAILYSSLTGYDAGMSDSDFVRIIYKNVLGRSGTTAPPDDDVRYWASRLSDGRDSKGSLIVTMLTSAHSFAGNATWGWVAQLLDNKVAVADYFALQQGLNYNSPSESISRTLSIAGAVTPTDTSAAKNLVGFTDATFNLTHPVVYGAAAKGPLNGATVTVYLLNADGTKGSALASGATRSDGTGTFAIALPAAPAGAVQVEVTGGSYTSPYDGGTLASTHAISAVVDSVASEGATRVSVNPLTHMSARLAGSFMALGYGAGESSRGAHYVVQVQYGLRSSPAAIIPKFDASAVAADPAAVHLGLVLTAIDTLGHRMAPSDPDAISSALAADYADGVLDGKAGAAEVTLAGSAYSASTLRTEFLRSVALSHAAAGAGLRPGYVAAHYGAGTIAESWQAQIVPVYVASDIQPYYTPTLSTQIPKTSSFDARATGYSCASGAALTFDASGRAQCNGGSSYSCSNGATLVTGSDGRVSCSDGSIAIYTGMEIPVYTAPTIQPYIATAVAAYTADRVVGLPSSGTIPLYTATTVHVLTQAERDAMMANDRAAGDLAASKVSGMPLNQAQIDAYRMINDAIFVAYGPFEYR